MKVGGVSLSSGLHKWSFVEDFKGMVGALRLWNYARSDSDICETMYSDSDMFSGKLQYRDLLRNFSSVKIVTLPDCRNM